MNSRVVYTVGANDEVTAVNQGWIDFARQNNGGSLEPDAVLGRPIWDFIADASTRAIYRQLFQRVRRGGGPARFAFRCDGPAVRRLLQMRISRMGSGRLVLATEILTAVRRTPVALLDPARDMSDVLVRLCAWCQRVGAPSGQWLQVEDALAAMGIFEGDVLPRITHGICDDCSTVMLASLDDSIPLTPIGIVARKSRSRE